MKGIVYLQALLFGVFFIGVVWGTWWLILLAGIFILIIHRSYTVLTVGLLLDVLTASNGISWAYIGFYFLIFLVTTLIVAFIKSRLV